MSECRRSSPQFGRMSASLPMFGAARIRDLMVERSRLQRFKLHEFWTLSHWGVTAQHGFFSTMAARHCSWLANGCFPFGHFHPDLSTCIDGPTRRSRFESSPSAGESSPSTRQCVCERAIVSPTSRCLRPHQRLCRMIWIEHSAGERPNSASVTDAVSSLRFAFGAAKRERQADIDT